MKSSDKLLISIKIYHTCDMSINFTGGNKLLSISDKITCINKSLPCRKPIKVKYPIFTELKVLLKVTLNLFELFLIWCLTWQPDLNLIKFLTNFYTNSVDKVDELVVRTDQGKYTILPQFVALYFLNLYLKTAPTNVLLILPFWLYSLLEHVNIAA